LDETLASNDDLNGSLESLGTNGAATDTLEPIGADSVNTDDITDQPAHAQQTGRSLRKPVLVGVAALAVALAITGGTVAAAHKTVSVTIDGQVQEVGTLAGSVEGALDSADVTIGEHDTVAPAIDTAISDGSQIVVEHGRLLTLTIDGQTREVWTTASTVEEALAELGQNPAAYQLSADRNREIPLDGLAVTANTIFNASVSVGGAAASAVQTSGKTVGDLLTEQGIVLGPLDTVTPDATTALSNGLTITVNRVTRGNVDEQVDVAQPADQQVEDSSLAAGTTSVTQQGSPGKDQVTWEITTTNGAETGKTEIARTNITPAQATIIAVGTKEQSYSSVSAGSSSSSDSGSSASSSDSGSSASAADTSSSSSSAAPVSSGSSGVNWDGIANCESTNNWSINTGNGYYGGLQFDISTWNSAGGSAYAARPDQASREEQISVAENLYASRGTSPWACAGAG
jgi:uncharacterized protein YabE (DUF348 family)